MAAIELKEYVGATFVNVLANKDKVNLTESYVQTYVDDDSLMVDIEGIHSVITRNDTYYTPECLKESIPYWTNPYERPVIMHHNEKDGKIIGRIKSVNYISESKRSETAALEFVTNIGDEEGKKGIQNGTLATVSIGAIAHDIRCSICGQNLCEEGFCEHDKGETYDGKRCYWIIKKIEPKELSFVIVPSDIYAHSTRVYDAVKKNKNNEVKESMSMFSNGNIFAELSESIKAQAAETIEEGAKSEGVKEGAQVDEEVKTDSNANETGKPEEGKKDPESQEPENKGSEDGNKDNEGGQEPEDKGEEQPKDGEGEKPEVKDEKPEENKEGEEEDKSKDEGNSLEATVKELEKEVATLKAENTKLKKSLDNEKRLKESAESELVSFRAAKKKTLIESVNSLRKELGLKEEDPTVLSESTDESLELSIKSLKEFKEVHKNTVAGLSIIESPAAVSDEKDNTSVQTKKVKTDVKEAHSDSNNFEEKLFSIIDKAWR